MRLLYLARRLGRFGAPALIAPTLLALLLAGSAGAAVDAGHRSSPVHQPAARAQPASPAVVAVTLHRAARVPAQLAAPAVAAFHGAWVPDLLVTSAGSFGAAAVARVGGLAGVQAVEPVDLGSVTIAGRPARLMGVDPSTFRGWTPALTARSDALWQRVALGQSAVSFDMAQGLSLPLGGVVRFAGSRSLPIRIGAFASVGIAGVDAIVSAAVAHALGLPQANALLVSAPHADPLAERSAIEQLLPAGDQVQLLQQVIVVRDAGEYLDRAQIERVLQAAASRIGSPYLWGGDGPHAFDCSGLVGWAFAQAGIEMPRTAAQQFLAGPHVPYADARPGDLLFWTYDPTDPGFVDHVALYIGNGMMIVAEHTGTLVTEAPVPLAHLAGVVRVDPAMAALVGGPRFP